MNCQLTTISHLSLSSIDKFCYVLSIDNFKASQVINYCDVAN